MNNSKDLFFSHSWRPDNLNRDNHKRVLILANAMKNYGWKCWVDENEIYGNIDACISRGIENSKCVLVFITENYCNKVNNTANSLNKRDSCLKEWTYSNTRNKIMIPIVMEPCLLNTSYWPDGIISLYFGSTLYINYTEDNVKDVVYNLSHLLKKHSIYPSNRNINNKYINNLKLYYSIINNSSKRIIKKNEIDILPPSPINLSPGSTPNISPNISKNNLRSLDNGHINDINHSNDTSDSSSDNNDNNNDNKSVTNLLYLNEDSLNNLKIKLQEYNNKKNNINNNIELLKKKILEKKYNYNTNKKNNILSNKKNNILSNKKNNILSNKKNKLRKFIFI